MRFYIDKFQIFFGTFSSSLLMSDCCIFKRIFGLYTSLALLFHGHSSYASKINKSRCIQPFVDVQEYSSEDFAPIHSFQGVQKNDFLFSVWAAQVANYSSVWEGDRISVLFSQVAKSRAHLQKFISFIEDDSDTLKFGVVRRHAKSNGLYRDRDTSWVSYAPIRKVHGRFVSDDSNGFADLILEVFPGLKVQKSKDFFTSTYTLRNGDELFLSKFRIEKVNGKNCIVIYHPREQDQIRIVRDVYAKLQGLYEKKISGLKLDLSDLKIFFGAMRGFFGSVNYFRGSAAIGRATFAGLHYNFFDRKEVECPFSSKIDVLSMVLDDATFVAKLVACARNDKDVWIVPPKLWKTLPT